MGTLSEYLASIGRMKCLLFGHFAIKEPGSGSSFGICLHCHAIICDDCDYVEPNVTVVTGYKVASCRYCGKELDATRLLQEQLKKLGKCLKELGEILGRYGK